MKKHDKGWRYYLKLGYDPQSYISRDYRTNEEFFKEDQLEKNMINSPFLFKAIGIAKEKVQEHLKIKDEDCVVLLKPAITEYGFIYQIFPVKSTESIDGPPNIRFGLPNEHLWSNQITYYEGNLYGDARKKFKFAIFFISAKLSTSDTYSFLICEKKHYSYIIRKILKEKKLKRKISANPVKPLLDGELLTEIEQEITNLFDKRIDFHKFGANINRGLLFTGDPGNGKTMTVRYLMDICKQKYGIKSHSIGSATIQEHFAKDQMTSLFNGQFVVFDDVDVDYFSRTKRSDIACAMLGAMDGIDKSEHVGIRIFTTNESIDNIDIAFKRPGRIDKIFKFEKPADDLREKFVKTWGDEILKHVDVDSLIDTTGGFSFAYMSEIKNSIAECIIFNKDINYERIVEDLKGRYLDKSAKKKLGFSQ